MTVSEGTRKELRIMEDSRRRAQRSPRSPLKAIRAKCIDCSGGNTAEVRNCVIPDCPLYPFRMGRRPEKK